MASNIKYDDATDERSEDVTSAISLDMLEVYFDGKKSFATTLAEIPKVKVNKMAKDMLEDDRTKTFTHSPDGSLVFEVSVRICFDIDDNDWLMLSGGAINDVPDLLATQAIPYRAKNINDEENTFVRWTEVNTDYVASVEAAIRIDDDDEEIFIVEYKPCDLTTTQYDFEFTDEERKLLRENIVGNDYAYFRAYLKTTTTSGEVLYDWKRF